jgi:hypothetical protein
MDDARFIYLLRRFNSNPRKIYHVIRELGKCIEWMDIWMDGWMKNWEQIVLQGSQRECELIG